MPLTYSGQHVLPSSSRVLRNFILAELDAPQPRPLGGNNGLPQGAVDCLEHNVVLAVTPLTEPLYDDALVRYSNVSHRDVVLVRSGFHPETLDPLRVDVALRSSCGGAILVPNLSLWRGRDCTLHLVPEQADLYVAVAQHGLDALLVAPWDSREERIEGMERAAAEVVRACCRARAGRDTI